MPAVLKRQRRGVGRPSPAKGDQLGRTTADGRVLGAMAASAFLPSALGALILAGTIAHIGCLFWNVTPRARLTAWLIYMAAAIVPLLIAIPAGTKAQRQLGHVGPFWRRYFLIAISATNIGIAASVWILLPGADPSLQLYMAMLYAWYILVLLHARDAADPTTFVGVAVILVSAAAFWLVGQAPLRGPVVAFLVAFGFTTVALQRALHRSVQAAVVARFEAEDARQRLADALLEVSAERDAKERFIAAASHDLQQPIHAARLYFNLLADRKTRSRDAALAGGRAAFRTVENLLETMLEHLRLEGGAVPVRLEPVSLSAVCEALDLQFTPMAVEAGLSLVTAQAREHGLADGDLLLRALGNLVDNAIKHSGGRTVEIGARVVDDATVVLFVRDDGVGLTAKNAARLFDTDTSFRRAAGKTVRGFGLGLPSARRIAKLLGGTLQVVSVPGQGCEFQLKLPRPRAEEATRRPRAPRALSD